MGPRPRARGASSAHVRADAAGRLEPQLVDVERDLHLEASTHRHPPGPTVAACAGPGLQVQPVACAQLDVAVVRVEHDRAGQAEEHLVVAVVVPRRTRRRVRCPRCGATNIPRRRTPPSRPRAWRSRRSSSPPSDRVVAGERALRDLSAPPRAWDSSTQTRIIRASGSAPPYTDTSAGSSADATNPSACSLPTRSCASSRGSVARTTGTSCDPALGCRCAFVGSGACSSVTGAGPGTSGKPAIGAGVEPCAVLGQAVRAVRGRRSSSI